MMKIVTILGARPQFIKAKPVSSAIEKRTGLSEVLVHTGQHFDSNMSDVFFDELDIRPPDYFLGVNGSGHGAMTGRMLEAVEGVLQREKPDCVLVYGDTNSTLAGALAAAKLHIPVAHIEAGLRSRDRRMPEEVNRVLVDNLSDQLFCPTETAVANLKIEGFDHRPVAIELVGDVMCDAIRLFEKRAIRPAAYSIEGPYVLATVHRAENTDNGARLAEIVRGLNEVHAHIAPVVLPLHPRTAGAIKRYDLQIDFVTLAPVGYLEMLWLTKHAELVVTDSGGLQKEAYMLGRACITLRDSTEWSELIDVGANRLVPANAMKILVECRENFGRHIGVDPGMYGGGVASDEIVESLVHRFANCRLAVTDTPG